VPTNAIHIDGLAQFTRDLRKVDAELPKVLRLAFNDAAELIVTESRRRIPKRSGRAASSVRAQSTRTAARVTGGSKRVPYYPWLDFGGRVGKGKRTRRPFLSDGRYIYRSFFDHQDDFAARLESSLVNVIRQAGIEVD
jgi:hypothetical protein